MRYWLISVPTTVFLSLGLFFLVTLLEKPAVEEYLRPKITTTVNNKQSLHSNESKIFQKPASASAFVIMEEQILGTKFIPTGTIITTDKGDNLLVLINKSIRLSSNYVPGDLVSLNSLVSATSGSMLRSEAASTLKEMFEVAAAEGISLTVNSAYRSYSQQVLVFNSWVASAGLKAAENFSARAGHSQHQLGTAVDLTNPGLSPFSEAFASSPAGVWLANNASKFGYVLSYPKGKELVTGYSYEPWHWRYIGKDNAQKMLDSGYILEVFLQKFGIW
ncbi:MAG TPA: M15 family metallopeptidase [Candidatus Nanoarchaeia archaeon]